MEEQLPFEKIERKILVKRKENTDTKYGIEPDKRYVEELLNYSVINVNKPAGPTSHQVSAYVQKILGINKSGHSGTLDPKVTGVLPVATGNATRIVQPLLKSGKEYVAIMHLHKEVSKEELNKVFKKFTGRIKQLPPIKSAVKRQWRYRTVYYLNIIEIDEKDVLFKVGCEAGTYIRKLCTDIGKELGIGAHMAELIRTKAGPFKYDETFSLQDLTDAYWYWKNENNEKFIRKIMRPVEEGVKHLAKIWIRDSSVNTLCNGADLKVPGISELNEGIEPDMQVAVMSLKNELVAIGIAKMSSIQMIKEKKGLAVVTKKVFMIPGTYPKIERV